MAKKSKRKLEFFLAAFLLSFASLLFWLTWKSNRREPAQAHQIASPAPQVIAPRPTPQAPAPSPARPEKIPQQPKPPPPIQTNTQIAIAPAPRTAEKLSAPVSPDDYPRPAQSIAEAQIALARQGISSGSIDGLMGSQTRAALQAFQQVQGLSLTGDLDNSTRELLRIESPALASYTVTSNDCAATQPLGKTWLEKSMQSSLAFESVLELVAERTRSHPNYLKKLNPAVDWNTITPGTELKVPQSSMPVMRTDAAFIRVYLSKRLLQVFDSSSNLLAHFPCSIAQRVEKRPVGELHIVAVAPNPNYTFDPAVFPESEEARQLGRKLILPPGPNNPVGVAWISLDRPGYGIHGTPQPEQVGRTESHGCFRLANWNAEHLLHLARIGMPVYIEP